MMTVCFVLGIGWLATFYVTNGSLAGFSALKNWNLIVGFVLILTGFVLALRWR